MIIFRRRSAIAFVALTLLCSKVQAQEAAEAENQRTEVPDRVIIVEGSRTDRDAARAQVRKLTRPARRQQPLERFYRPVCPFVRGLDDGTASVIIERVKENARAVGLSVGNDGCDKNMLLAFVDDVESEIDNLLEHEPWAFGSLQSYERDRVENELGPTRAWHSSVYGDSEGVPLPSIDGKVPVSRSFSSSRIRLQNTKLIDASVVLIDRSAIKGKTVRQLADFFTLRALVPVVEEDPDDPSRLDTILSLFNIPDGPAGLTLFDEAYLKGYYAGNATLMPPNSLQTNIARTYARDKMSEEIERKPLE